MDAKAILPQSEKHLDWEWPDGGELGGTESATIDDKGRLLFSKKKREILGQDFVFRLGGRPFLEAIPNEIWERMKEEARLQFTSGSAARDHMRFFFANVDTGQNFDGQGRVVVPHRLRKAAGLNKDVLIVGCGFFAELWDAETYDKYLVDPYSIDDKRQKAMDWAEDKMEGKWRQQASS